jgi:hypothetical protein
MKKTLLLSLLITAFSAHSDNNIVPLDMTLGYWEITSEIGENDIIDKMLASMPESQRAPMRAMMESNMKPPVVKQCITEGSMKDMDKQLKKSFGGEQQCQFTVAKSTSTEFMGELNCEGNIITIHTNVITPKRHEATVVSNIAQMGTMNIRTVTEWKTATCPAEL